MYKQKQILKTLESSLRNIKTGIYIKSLQIKTDYTQYKTEFRNFHPKFYDVDRTLNKYIREVRDFKNLPIRIFDPLYFDHEFEPMDGGLQGLINQMKRANVLGNNSNSLISPYKVINLLYNIALKEMYHEKEFFIGIEKTINISNIKLDDLDPRYSYGFLYASYKTGWGRPETIHFFENYIEGRADNFFCRWIITLLEVLIKGPMFSYERVNRLINQHFLEILIMFWEKELVHNTKHVSLLMDLLREKKILNQKIWDRFIEDCKEKADKNYKPPMLIYYDSFLKNLNFIINEPTSYKYQDKEVIEILSKMKSLNKDPYDIYLYNSEEIRFNTYNDMLLQRNDVSSETHIGYSPKEEEVKEEKVKVVYQEEKNYDHIINEFKNRIISGEHILIVKFDMMNKFPNESLLLDELTDEMMDLHNKNLIDRMIKEGKLDKIFDKKPDPKLGSTPASPQQDASAGGKGDGKEMKKKKGK